MYTYSFSTQENLKNMSTSNSSYRKSTIEITGKCIVVTGGGNGIGREVVRALYNNGNSRNTIYVVDRDAEKLRELERECGGGGAVVPIVVDLTDWDETAKVLERSLPEVVHGLVNNAGVGDQGGFLESDPQTFDKVIGVNTRAVVNVSQVVAKRIIQYNKMNGTIDSDRLLGSIVNISSLASRFPTKISTSYNVSKAAVDMLTKGMALELGPHNIRVNSVNPGIVIDTDLAQGWVAAIGDLLTERLLARTPLKRVVQIRDVVNAVLFLLSDAAPMVHGDSLFVDGGYSVS